jgi:hypothetical protein
MIHESGKEQDIVACWKDGKEYPTECLHFRTLCPYAKQFESFKDEGCYVKKIV